MTHRRSPNDSPMIGSFRTIHRLRTPQYVPQAAEPLNHEQRELDHFMRCTKVGCTRCAS